MQPTPNFNAALQSLRKSVLRGRQLPAKPEVISLSSESLPGGLRLERLQYRTEGGPLGGVPTLLVSPPPSHAPPHPTIIWLHATGSSKDALLPIMQSFSAAGYLTAAPDCRYHGERLDPEPGTDHRTAYQHALIRAWRSQSEEHPFLLDNVYDILGLLDMLCARPDVDARRIGMSGISLGGMHTWLAACLDERVAVAAPMIGIQYWGWALEHEAWHGRVESVPLLFEAAAHDLGHAGAVNTAVVEAVVSKVLPGLLTHWDTPLSLPSVAPRPLLVLNGELDPRCPLEGVQLALEPARAAYEAAGAGDKLQLHVERGVGHKQTPGMLQAARNWFDTHL